MLRTKKKKPAFIDLLGQKRDGSSAQLTIKGLRQNNLRNLNLSIPHDKITAIVGPSGSGKSSLAFDTLFAEGRWRFMESLSTYTRLFLDKMSRPDVDSISAIRPAIAIEQKNPVRSARSTVATATEIYDYLRVLFARAGRRHCPQCGSDVRTATPEIIARELLQSASGNKAEVGFSANISASPGESAAETMKKLLKDGFVRALVGSKTVEIERLDKNALKGADRLLVITDRMIINVKSRARLVEALAASMDRTCGEAWVRLAPASGSENKQKEILTFKRENACKECHIKVAKPTPVLFSFNHPLGACGECRGFGKILKYDTALVIPDETLSLREGAIEPWTKPSYRWFYDQMATNACAYNLDMDKPFKSLNKKERSIIIEGTKDFDGIEGFFAHLERKRYKLHIRVFLSRYKSQFTCNECDGARLKKDALCVTIGGLNIYELTRMTLKQAREFLAYLKLTPAEAEISKEVLKQLTSKLDFLNRTGLGYITLNRMTKTLSGGESQRVALANQMGSALSGVLYILDEPSIGLHPRDIGRLIEQIHALALAGNTVVVVEHDSTVIRSADFIVELGPGAGQNGGRLVYSGDFARFQREARTLTSKYLSGEKSITVPRWRRSANKDFIILKGARGNNLKNVDLKIPLNTLTCITGVSGSGKSTLIKDTLYNAICERFKIRADTPLPFDSLSGTEEINGIRLIDQAPIGKTPRSNPITYLGCFDEIRKFYAGLALAKGAGLTAGSFSFNVPGGRCEPCKGQGVQKLEMYFLPDIYIKCPQCNAKRYKPQVLQVRYKGKNIFDILESTFDEVSAIIPLTPAISKKFGIIRDVGLGYLRLGQSATTLSGGEAQRLKLSRELSGKDSVNTLYLLDEPTTGLHTHDIKNLLNIIARLVDTGNSVLIIEHNLECIKRADHIIDIGPEGGDEGGEIIAQGTPEKVALIEASHTGRYLREVLRL